MGMGFMQRPNYLLVYGTLRKGEPNGLHFFKDEEYIHTNVVIPGWKMYDLWRSYPGIKPGTNSNLITCDLIKCSTATKNRVDRMETAANYRLHHVPINVDDVDSFATLYVYAGVVNPSKIIPNGNWVPYNKKLTQLKSQNEDSYSRW